jgi:hypothetical protein
VIVGARDIVLVHTGHVSWKLGLAPGSPDARSRSEPCISRPTAPPTVPITVSSSWRRCLSWARAVRRSTQSS